ncbi:MerC domain-containing protein [Winogradskyella endarachnes]|uniref:MerC family mercury resistance protein n=1 Tax=Winogradskyella endarachnes TaxID=2681965 RepID=A0A6L6U6F3_9FLAO|nr:MerC domain-containing protein [Winogradskyella endarachnes]MUU77106.1 MerC family mercury resistance protein [Winogradskyella endarachnes]
MISINQKPDILGTFASSLCLIHCVATPFIFIAHSCAASCSTTAPIWWKSIDYIFLVISFFAIYWSTKTTSINWIKPMLWLSWLGLVFVILNEKLELIPLAESAIYFPAIALVILHLYNRKYCKCETDKCCVNEN